MQLGVEDKERILYVLPKNRVRDEEGIEIAQRNLENILGERRHLALAYCWLDMQYVHTTACVILRDLVRVIMGGHRFHVGRISLSTRRTWRANMTLVFSVHRKHRKYTGRCELVPVSHISDRSVVCLCVCLCVCHAGES